MWDIVGRNQEQMKTSKEKEVNGRVAAVVGCSLKGLPNCR